MSAERLERVTIVASTGLRMVLTLGAVFGAIASVTGGVVRVVGPAAAQSGGSPNGPGSGGDRRGARPIGDPSADEDRSARVSSPKKKPGTVYTFYGLRKLEQDPDVAAGEKLREWRAFIERAEKQLAYAERAVKRWRVASRRSVVKAARATDRDPTLTPRDKVERWSKVVRRFPKTPEGRTAQRRVAHWSNQETKRLVLEAEAIERAGRPKLERLKAWDAVLAWVAKGPEAKAAQRRIQALQRELYEQARNADRSDRIALRTKLAAWRDVLDGRPTGSQRSRAERRVKALEAEVRAQR